MDRARAPYNFVPLAKNYKPIGTPPGHDQYYEGYKSGYLELTLTAKTPLYIRSTLTHNQYTAKQNTKKIKPKWKQDKADFFSPGYDPTKGDKTNFIRIPGSSLRGMVRNLVEILSSSRPDGISRDLLYYRGVADRVDSPIGRKYRERIKLEEPGGVYAGYMRRRGSRHFIQPAKNLNEHTYFRARHSLATDMLRQAGKGGVRTYDPLASKNPEEFIGSKNNWSRIKIWFKIPPTTGNEITEARWSAQQPAGENWERGWLVVPGAEPPPRVDKRGKSNEQINREKDEKRQNKQHWIIPEADNTQEEVEIPEEDLFTYRDGGGITQAVSDNGFAAVPDDNFPDKTIPCFYVKWTDQDKVEHVSFGHTAYFRLPYQKRPIELLPAPMRRDLLKDADSYDLAEAVFGNAAGTRAESFAGRVFFEDAKLEPGAELSQPAHPHILSTPKPTTFQHYLKQARYSSPEDRNFWDKTGAEISGYKFYWHRRKQDDPNYWVERVPLRENDTQHTLIQPLNPGATFKGRVRFENLRPEELGCLCAALVLPTGHAHKLGMGKPLGLGSVQIQVERVVISERKARYNSLFDVSENSVDWHLEEKVTDPQSFIQAFESWLHLSKGSLWQHFPELKALLNFDNSPEFEATRYMEIAHAVNRNEYKDRPTLPSPVEVLGNNRRPADHVEEVEGDATAAASDDDIQNLLKKFNRKK